MCIRTLPLVSRLIMASTNIKHLLIVTQNASDQADDFVKRLTELRPMHIVFLEAHTFSTPTTRLMTSLLERQLLQLMWENLNFLVFGSGETISAVIHEAQRLDLTLGRRSLLRHFSRWILVPTDGDKAILSMSDVVLDNVNIALDLEAYPDNPWNVTATTVMLSLFWTPRGREWRVLREDGLKDAPFPNLRNGLNGREILVTVLEWLSYLKRDKMNNGTLSYSGVSVEILTRLSIAYNFSITFVEPEDQRWGENINGSWTGIVGMLQRMEADICGVPYVMNVEREKVMTFSYTISDGYQAAVYKRVVDANKHWYALTSCFKWDVYVCGLVTCACVCAMFLLFESIDPGKLSMSNGKRKIHFADIAMLCVMVPFHQCSSRLPQSNPSKVLLGAWWFFCTVITAVFTGNIIASLMVSREYIPFRTLGDVIQQDLYAVGVSSGGFIELMLRTSNDSQMLKLWEMAKKSKIGDQVSKEDEMNIHLSRLRAGNYIMLLDKGTIATLMTEECGFTKLHEEFMHMYGSFTFPKYSPLPLLFLAELMHLTENGLLATWHRMWSPKKVICTDDHLPDKRRLNSDDLLSALVAVAIGVFVAGLALMYEKFARNSLTRTKTNIHPPQA